MNLFSCLFSLNLFEANRKKCRQMICDWIYIGSVGVLLVGVDVKTDADG